MRNADAKLSMSKMHLLNILNQLGANEQQKVKALVYFKTNTVSVQAVRHYLENF